MPSFVSCKAFRIAALALLLAGPVLAAPRTLPRQQAAHFCRLMVSDGEGSVYPLSVYAANLTQFLFGTKDYGEYSAQQVLTGYIFYYEDLAQEPLASRDGFEFLAELHSGSTLRLFPHRQDKGKTTWYAPTSHIPENVPEEHRRYMHDVFTRLNGEVQAGKWKTVDAYIDRMIQYQCQYGGTKPSSAPFPITLFAAIVLFALAALFVYRKMKGYAVETSTT